MNEARLATIAELRARFAAPRVQIDRLPAGVAGLDGWLGGWPSPGLTELVGAPGSGRLAPILPALRALLRRGRTVVWIDPLRQLHPPGLDSVLQGLVILRPPGDQAAWAAEQVARSGAVDALVMMDLPRLGRAGLRLGRACESGSTAVFVVGEEAEPDLPAALRLRAEGWTDAGLQLTCTRARDGRLVGARVIPMDGGQARPQEGAAAQVERVISSLERRIALVPQAVVATPKVVKPQVATPQVATPTVAAPPVATPPVATPTVATPQDTALSPPPAANTPWTLHAEPRGADTRVAAKASGGPRQPAKSTRKRTAAPRHRPQLRLVVG